MNRHTTKQSQIPDHMRKYFDFPFKQVMTYDFVHTHPCFLEYFWIQSISNIIYQFALGRRCICRAYVSFSLNKSLKKVTHLAGRVAFKLSWFSDNINHDLQSRNQLIPQWQGYVFLVFLIPLQNQEIRWIEFWTVLFGLNIT